MTKEVESGTVGPGRHRRIKLLHDRTSAAVFIAPGICTHDMETVVGTVK